MNNKQNNKFKIKCKKYSKVMKSIESHIKHATVTYFFSKFLSNLN